MNTYLNNEFQRYFIQESIVISIKKRIELLECFLVFSIDIFTFVLYLCSFVFAFQNAPITSWSSQRQVLVPSWQQLPGLSTHRPAAVQQHIVPETLTSTAVPDSWRRSLMVENFDQSSAVFPMVSCPLLSNDLDPRWKTFKVSQSFPW